MKDKKTYLSIVDVDVDIARKFDVLTVDVLTMVKREDVWTVY